MADRTRFPWLSFPASDRTTFEAYCAPWTEAETAAIEDIRATLIAAQERTGEALHFPALGTVAARHGLTRQEAVALFMRAFMAVLETDIGEPGVGG